MKRVCSVMRRPIRRKSSTLKAMKPTPPTCSRRRMMIWPKNVKSVAVVSTASPVTVVALVAVKTASLHVMVWPGAAPTATSAAGRAAPAMMQGEADDQHPWSLIKGSAALAGHAPFIFHGRKNRCYQPRRSLSSGSKESLPNRVPTPLSNRYSRSPCLLYRRS